MKNWIQPGHTLTLVAPYDVASGQGVLVGAIFGVASFYASEGDPVEAAVEGVFEIARETGTPWTQGAVIYWDDGERRATHEANDNTPIGAATEAATDEAQVGRVRLTPGAAVAAGGAPPSE